MPEFGLPFSSSFFLPSLISLFATLALRFLPCRLLLSVLQLCLSSLSFCLFYMSSFFFFTFLFYSFHSRTHYQSFLHFVTVSLLEPFAFLPLPLFLPILLSLPPPPHFLISFVRVFLFTCFIHFFYQVVPIVPLFPFFLFPFLPASEDCLINPCFFHLHSSFPPCLSFSLPPCRHSTFLLNQLSRHSRYTRSTYPCIILDSR